MRISCLEYPTSTEAVTCIILFFTIQVTKSQCSIAELLGPFIGGHAKATCRTARIISWPESIHFDLERA